jgi:hypothetical protein
MNGVPLMIVAENLGHADTRMVEKHYGHLAPGYVADAIRAGAPKFGIKPEKAWSRFRTECCGRPLLASRVAQPSSLPVPAASVSMRS